MKVVASNSHEILIEDSRRLYHLNAFHVPYNTRAYAEDYDVDVMSSFGFLWLSRVVLIVQDLACTT